MKKNLLLLLFCLSALAQRGFALGQVQYVESVYTPGSFPMVTQKVAASLCADTNDFPGVLRAVNDLQTDVVRVTGCRPEIVRAEDDPGKNVIIIGTIGKSRLVARLIREKKMDVSEIAGQWESFLIQVVPRPWPGVDSALVICGSDQRGTIYGIYDLSEEMGVSPWHFWADVPAKPHDELFVKAGTFAQGPPAVKYRGIF